MQPHAQRSILIPLDGTLHANEAIPVARVFANLEEAEIHIVHVSPEPMSPAAWRGRWPSDERLSRAVIHTRQGDPVKSILDVAAERQSSHIVMCTHTGMPKPEGQLGSVADKIFQNAPCPVVLVRPIDGVADWKLHTVLLPHDANPGTAAALGPARRMVEKAHAKLVVLHVADLLTARPAEPGAIPPPRFVDQPQYEWPDWTREFLDRLGRETDYSWINANVRLLLGEGEPAEAILRTARAERVDLIVLAWHGSLAPHHAQTIKRIIAGAPCPLLILRV